ncbi:MAG: hypothetical protein DRN14_03605 [Thermoplasmata archaeon]|nr:MAG: hypothetical protein DRN14_03605 [Thermoplasmata archaeon]
MALDPLASEFFFRSSIKKYIIDSLSTIEGKLVIFDSTILYEEVSTYNVDEWFVVNFGMFDRSLMSRNLIEINCCTRQDAEGVKLSKLTDLVVGYLTDTSMTDTMRRIAMYDATEIDPLNWTEIGKMLVLKFSEGFQNTTPDKTKVKTITPILTWGSVV